MTHMPAVVAGFRRVVGPGGIVMVGFDVGEGHRRKTEGYGGHPMDLEVHRRPVSRVAGWLAATSWTIETHVVIDPDTPSPGGIVIARRPHEDPDQQDRAGTRAVGREWR